jgi:probable rRNA maturation factor
MKYCLIKATVAKIPRKRLLRLFKAIERTEKPPDSSINIIFIGDKRMLTLNKKYRGVSRTTDVISFYYGAEVDDDSPMGEIYISTATAARRARRDGVSFDAMIARLGCHGYLHLLGYDHVKREERLKMEAKERHYLQKAGGK